MGHRAQWGASAVGLRCDLIDVLVALVEAESLHARRICSISHWAVSSHSEVGSKQMPRRELQPAQNQFCF